MKIYNASIAAIIIFTMCCLTACKPAAESAKPVPASTGTETSSFTATDSASSSDTEKDPDVSINGDSSGGGLDDVTVQFKSGAGDRAFSMLHSKNSGEIVEASGKVLLTFSNPDGNEKLIRVQDTQGKFVCFVKIRSDHLKLEGDAGVLLYKFNIEESGDYKLKDAKGETIYKLKAENYGFKLREGEDGDSIYKIKLKKGKVSIKSNDGKTVLVTRSEVPQVVMSCFAMDKLPKNLQMSLAYALMYKRL